LKIESADTVDPGVHILFRKEPDEGKTSITDLFSGNCTKTILPYSA